jgi:hypothetical protein
MRDLEALKSIGRGYKRAMKRRYRPRAMYMDPETGPRPATAKDYYLGQAQAFGSDRLRNVPPLSYRSARPVNEDFGGFLSKGAGWPL